MISIHAPHTGRDVKSVLLPEPFLPFQSTRPIRGATLVSAAYPVPWNISIHAPHTGRDSNTDLSARFKHNFNPRAPYGARHKYAIPRHMATLFQSTRPIRGATSCPIRCCVIRGYFNPRAPYGARPRHGLTAEITITFQSTRPIRGATAEYPSINALRIHFNPRAPYGARRLGAGG